MLPHFNYVYAPTPKRLDLKAISEKSERVSKDGDLDNRKTDVLNREMLNSKQLWECSLIV